MPVSHVKAGTNSQIVSASRGKTGTAEFSKVLNDSVPGTTDAPLQTGRAEIPIQKNTGRVAFVELGRISKETPTVSHILKNHPEYSGKCWDIVFSSANRGKLFTKIREGTVVAIKSGSNELVWGKELSRLNAKHSEDKAPVKGGADQAIVIGTISKDRPTVSHLFQAHSDFDNCFWDIIHAPINSSNKYASLRPGTRVVLNSKTMELSFQNTSAAGSNTKMPEIKTPEEGSDNAGIHHESLAEAVKPYIGTPYNKIDCYGLVVRGLQNQGVQYKGHGGIRERLEAMAVRNGLPGNAYFNGEGLVEKAGTRVFSKSLHNISNAREKTEELYSEITPYLQEGCILSFSTTTRGHTGIVSRQGGEWTYINSGVIDNQVFPVRISKGVGEEFLKAELDNWVVHAAHKKEPLTVTIGHVDQNQSQRSRG